MTTRPAIRVRGARQNNLKGVDLDLALGELHVVTGVSGEIEVTENEWAKACNLRDRYRLYVVFDCATSRPRLVGVRDPFGRLLATAKGSVVIAGAEILSAATNEEGA